MSGRVEIIHGDCVEVMRRLKGEGVTVQSIVTDPPYHLTSIVKRFGAPDAAPPSSDGATGVYKRSARGFMGQTWDGGDVAFRPETWRAAYDLLPPGGHLLAFSGTRTYHRMACAVEDAGFEIRDMVAWLYGSGFPKSHDVAKAIDKAARGVPHGGADPTSVNHGKFKGGCSDGNPAGRGFGAGPGAFMREQGAARASCDLVPEAEAWEGWGTALKPALEPIVLARKPLDGTVAETVLAHGTGALHVDACRVEAAPGDYDHPGNLARRPMARHTFMAAQQGAMKVSQAPPSPLGRWPANVVHDCSEEVEAAFPEAGGGYGVRGKGRQVFGGGLDRETGQTIGFGDAGSAARFFYAAKADKDDRIESKHPTVKPVALMRWLVRLITPPGGTVLDPFAGTGTMGAACLREGFRAVLIEQSAEYVADIRRRIDRMTGADSPLFASISDDEEPPLPLGGAA